MIEITALFNLPLQVRNRIEGVEIISNGVEKISGVRKLYPLERFLLVMLVKKNDRN